LDFEREQGFRPPARAGPLRHGVLDREVDEFSGDVLGGEAAFRLERLSELALSASIAFVVYMTRRWICPL
jgi:hypothetical protein